jgi:asparaginyl-tRNA synthetase
MSIRKTQIAKLLKEGQAGTEVFIQGWVRTRRGNKNVAFIAVNDGSIIHNIQVVADMERFDEALIRKVNTGAAIGVHGKLVESLGKGQTFEIQASEIEIYGKADQETYPLQN